ncbi:MAG TPA: response regulator transcription factor [Saprospiraceae bacterium]|nr:response regulator transcription factor [Saprospiraceae bacterium]
MQHHILIIEDEIPAANHLKSLIEKYLAQADILEILDSVEGAVSWLQTHPKPDLIFMDIQLADGQSFDIFTQVNIQCPIIFITAYDEYAIHAFDVNGLDYLLKPINLERFQMAIDKYRRHTQTPNYNEILQEIRSFSDYKSRFLVKQGDQFIVIPVAQIASFQFLEGYTHLMTKTNRQFIIDDSIEKINRQLNPRFFFQVNRKTIVHIDSISKISSWFNSRLKVETTPKSPNDIIVSRERVKDFKAFLNR